MCVHPALNSYSFMINISIFISVLFVSLVSLAGVFLLSMSKTFLQKMLLYFVSFAVGALFANVFLHILPKMAEVMPDLHTGFALVLLGIVMSFLLEKCIHWHHCHNLDCSCPAPVGTMMLIGDGIHNITDGILIAAAYLVDIELGIATTIAIILHEIPQEIGDFAVLLHSGWSRGKALLANALSALTAFLGAILVLVLHEYVHNIELLLLPITAGNFLYIAGSDLIPVLHKESKIKNTIIQFLSMLAGIGLIHVLIIVGHGHMQEDGHNHSGEATLHEEEIHHKE